MPATIDRAFAETTLAWFTVVFVSIYAPLETVVSWDYGLLSPYYLVDFVAMVVLALGSWRSLRARPLAAPAILTAGWGWCAANFWRATLDRIAAVARGENLDFGHMELPLAYGATFLAVACFGMGIWIVVQRADA